MYAAPDRAALDRVSWEVGGMLIPLLEMRVLQRVNQMAGPPECFPRIAALRGEVWRDTPQPWFDGADLLDGELPEAAADVAAAIDRLHAAFLARGPWHAALSALVDVAQALDPRLGASAGFALRMVRAPMAATEHLPGVDEMQEQGLDADELLALGLRTLDRLLAAIEAGAPALAEDLRALRLGVRTPREWIERAGGELDDLAGRADERTGAALLEATFQVDWLRDAFRKGDVRALTGLVVGAGHEVRRMRADLGGGASTLADDALAETADFWRRPALDLPGRPVPSAQAPVPPLPSWGTTFPLYEQAVDRAVAEAFVALGKGDDAGVVARLRARVHRDTKLVHDPVRDEAERWPSGASVPASELGPSPARLAARDTFDRWLATVCAALGLPGVPEPAPKPPILPEALASWEPGDRSGRAAAEHLAAHLLRLGLPAQRNAILIQQLGFETVWTREDEVDHLIVPHTGTDDELRKRLARLVVLERPGSVLRVALPRPLPPDVAAILADTPLAEMARRWTRELALAPEQTVEGAVAELPRWLADLEGVTGRRLDLDDPLSAWATVDDVVLAARPHRDPAPDAVVPVGLLAVLAVAATEALRRRIGGRFGALTAEGWSDGARLADLAYMPALATDRTAVALGRKVHERYAVGAAASVLALGKEALASSGEGHADGVLLPSLQPPGWDGGGTVHRALLDGVDGLPRVSFVDDRPTTRWFRQHGDPAALEREALANLEARLASFAWREQDGVVVCRGEYAECLVLSRHGLREMARALGATRFHAAVPCRGVLLGATPGTEGFDEVVRGAHVDALPSERLSLAVLAVEDGAVVGVVGAIPEAPAKTPPQVVVDGDVVSVTVEGVDGRVVPALIAAGIGTRPIRLELRLTGAADTPQALASAAASGRFLARQLREHVVPGVEAIAVFAAGEPVRSALEGIDDPEIEALAFVPAAVVVVIAAPRGGITGEQVAVAETWWQRLRDPRLLEAFASTQTPFVAMLEVASRDSERTKAVLDTVARLLERLPDPEGTKKALWNLGALIGGVWATRGPDGERKIDRPELMQMMQLSMILGLEPGGAPERAPLTAEAVRMGLKLMGAQLADRLITLAASGSPGARLWTWDGSLQQMEVTPDDATTADAAAIEIVDGGPQPRWALVAAGVTLEEPSGRRIESLRLRLLAPGTPFELVIALACGVDLGFPLGGLQILRHTGFPEGVDIEQVRAGLFDPLDRWPAPVPEVLGRVPRTLVPNGMLKVDLGPVVWGRST